jgi:hypothetical protein
VHSARMQNAFHIAELRECRISGTPFESPFESPEERGGNGIEQTPREQKQLQQQLQQQQISKFPDRTIQNIPKDAGVGGGGGGGESTEHSKSNAQASNAPSQTAAPKGLAANLVSTIRSFLPATKSQVSASQSPTAQQAGLKKPVPRVKALEAAEAAKKREEEKNAERARQKQEAERIRQERLKKAKAVADEQQKKGVVHKDGYKELCRPHPLQHGTSETKADNQQRPGTKNPAPGFTSTSASTKPHAAVAPPKPFSATSGAASLAEAKQRLAKIQQQAVILQQRQATSNGDAVLANSSQNCSKPQAGVPSRPAPQTYEISPYKSDFDSEGEDEPRKPVPEWARGRSLMAQLVAQMHIDPDEVFQQHAKTCSLDEVFAAPTGKPGKRDFTRRTSSGNWLEDRVTWKEELGYKKAMGYI